MSANARTCWQRLHRVLWVILIVLLLLLLLLLALDQLPQFTLIPSTPSSATSSPHGGASAQLFPVAAYRDWERGFDLIPSSPDDFASQNTWIALQEMHQLGANAVTFTTSYEVTDLTSSAIYSGRYTATDASLAVSIQRAQSLHMLVNLSVYVDILGGEWRAYLTPTDRNLWFGDYGKILDHLASIAQRYHVHRLSIGAELISLTSATVNPDNTERWLALIRGVRSRYTGLVMYAANWGGSFFLGEYLHIQFWRELDVVGIDGYYPLATTPNPSISALELSWQHIHDAILLPFARQVRRPLVFAEVGYRSILGVAMTPSNSKRAGSYDVCAQANAYYALLASWQNSHLLDGLYWWYWDTSQQVGAPGDTSFSPRLKPAATILQSFWNRSPDLLVQQQAILQRCASGTTGGAVTW